MKNILDVLNSSGLRAGLGNAGQALKGTLQNTASNTPGGMGGLLGSAALGGLLGALLSGKGVGKTVGKVAQGALVTGGVAAAGALAWKFYQKWSQENQAQQAGQAQQADYSSQPQNPEPSQISAGSAGYFGQAPQAGQVSQVGLPPAEEAAMLLLEAVVFAARADGHIDAAEQTRIQETAVSLFPGRDMPELMNSLMNQPIDPALLAARVRHPDEGRDLYRLSCAAINVDNFMERSYLDGLARALGIADAEKDQLEREAAAAVAQNAG